MKKVLLLSCICIAIALVTNAQTEDKKWNVGLHGGISQFDGGLGNDFYKTNEGLSDLNYFGGISVSRYLSSYFDVSLLGTKGQVGYKGAKGSFSSGFSSGLVNFRFNLIGPKSPIRPYIFAGGGAMLFDKNLASSNNKVDFIIPDGGAGINIKLSSVVMINFQEMFLYSNNNKRDGSTSNSNDAYLFHSAGFTFNFGKKRDADKDGVSDYYDKCPNTPIGVMVDKRGCPLDRDKDGVPDYLDSCPDVAGPAALHGCPDRDGDGVADKDDRCPDQAGPANLQGCPDRDGDGIADIDDRCPDQAGPASLKGCPDSDGDGVPDIDDLCPNTKPGYKVGIHGCPFDNDKDGIVNEEDRCPDQAGPASLKGCPDTDGDGVPDIDDRCPTVKGTIANHGCPEISKESIKRITEIGSKVFFENNSDKLKVASLVQLDELATILQKYETANLIIEGYTDSRGSDALNMTLSQKRTESVKIYLIGKGIVESRLTATGFGKASPIADNNTAIGRAKNRRVELKTSY